MPSLPSSEVCALLIEQLDALLADCKSVMNNADPNGDIDVCDCVGERGVSRALSFGGGQHFIGSG
jgi:hypothetical protein